MIGAKRYVGKVALMIPTHPSARIMELATLLKHQIAPSFFRRTSLRFFSHQKHEQLQQHITDGSIHAVVAFDIVSAQIAVRAIEQVHDRNTPIIYFGPNKPFTTKEETALLHIIQQKLPRIVIVTSVKALFPTHTFSHYLDERIEGSTLPEKNAEATLIFTSPEEINFDRLHKLSDWCRTSGSILIAHGPIALEIGAAVSIDTIPADIIKEVMRLLLLTMQSENIRAEHINSIEEKIVLQANVLLKQGIPEKRIALMTHLLQHTTIHEESLEKRIHAYANIENIPLD